MKRRCSHRNPGTGKECMRTALDGSETCKRHAPGYVAPKRAARVMPAEQAAEIDARLAAETLPERPAYGGPERSVYEWAVHHTTCAMDLEQTALDDSQEPSEREWAESRMRDHYARAVAAALVWLLDGSTASAVSLAHQPAGRVAEPVEAVEPDALGRDPRVAPRCGDCGECALCDAVLAYEDRAQAPRDAHEAPPAHESADDPRRHTGGPVVDVAGDLLLSERGCEVWHCDWRRLAERARELGGVDALIVDAPYSERTHSGHDGAAAQANGADASWLRTNGRVVRKIRRRDLDYGAFSAEDVSLFVDAWEPLTRGWFVSLTDDELFPAWRSALSLASRQTFQDVPCVISGMAVRLTGDGPSSWCIHAAVARPRTKAMAKWGTLPGAYHGPAERQPVVGGKPLWLMRALVRDYTRPGDLVCDPCMGAGTTALACVLEGRRFLGGDAMREHADISVERLRLMPGETKGGQLALLATG